MKVQITESAVESVVRKAMRAVIKSTHDLNTNDKLLFPDYKAVREAATIMYNYFACPVDHL